MKITIEQTALAAALARVVPVVPAKATIPALQNVLINATDVLGLTATDLDIEIKATAEANIEQSGDVTVPAKTLAEVVKRIPKGKEITIETGDGDVTIRSGRIKATIATLPAEDFPRMATDEYSFETELAADQLANLLGKVSFAMSTEEAKFYLNGVYLHATDHGLSSVATDGHRLALWHCDAECDGMPGVIIPARTVGMLQSLESGATFQASETKVRFSGEGWSIVSKVVDGRFPDYTRIIPDRKGSVARFDGKAMKAAVDRVGAVLDKTSNAVKWSVGEDGIDVSGRTGANSVEDFVDATLEGGALEIGFNSKYVVGAMQHLDGNAVCYMDGSESPARIEDDADEAWTLVIMPMRM